MKRLEAGLSAIAAFFCMHCGGGDSAEDGAGGAGNGTGGSGAGPSFPPICAAREPVDVEQATAVHDFSITGVVSDIYTEYFTGDVAIAEDVLVVGVPSWLSMVETDRPAALVYRYDGQSFVFETELLAAAPADPTPTYGDTVEISHSGRTIIVADDRSAFIFRHDGSEWTGGEELAPRNEGDFLSDVSVTDERAVVGYYHNGDLPGSAYVYRFDGSAWQVEQRIVDTRLDSSSGTPVAIDGERLVIVDSQARGYAYTFDGAEWTETQDLNVSSNVAMHGNHLIGRTQNQVEIFENDANEWVNCGNEPCYDGCDISLFGSRIALGGSPSTSGTHHGVVIAFDGSAWVENHESDLDARNVDIGRSFAVFSAEGFVENQIQVVELAPWP